MRQLLLLISLMCVLNSCSFEKWLWIKNGGPRKARQFKAKEKAFEKLSADIYSKSDTVLNVWCYDQRCDLALYGIFWVYSLNGDMYLQKVKKVDSKKLTTYEPKLFPQGRDLIGFILSNRLDTVTTRPSDWMCYDCGSISFELTIGSDTILNDFVRDIDLERGDSLHLKNQLASRIAEALKKNEITAANNR
ncbi:MAG: hypothetical protein KDB98_01205 [Flavobacteriales bacterium]|nr:hypothetical protein [Flavobacteriales bacterium]